MVVLASGTVAATVIAVLAITIIPRRAAGPVAMSATTLPPYSVAPAAVQQAPSADLREPVRFERSSLTAASGLALTGAPRLVAAPAGSNTGAQTETSSDAEMPPDARVHVLTASHVYHLTWGDLGRIIAPDESIVVDDTGQLLGTFVDGRFVAD